MTYNKQRIEWIDYLKAFACLLVVIGHLIQSLQKSNIDPYVNITSFIDYFIYLFHMPLFMCVSGFLYCKYSKRYTINEYRKFTIKKFLNLAIPYFTFYIMFVGINMIFSTSVNTKRGIDDILNIFNNPMPPYWFLYSLLSLFIIIPLIEYVCKYNKRLVFSLLIILKIVSIFVKTNIYFIDTIMSYAIYFYFGCFIKEEKEYNRKHKENFLFISLYFIFSLVYYNYRIILNSNIIGIFNIIFAIAGIWICINIFRTKFKSIFLNTFKKYTFQIYLMHTIFAAGIRIVLLKLNIDNYFIHLIIGLILSIYVPVLISIISEKIKYTDFFFYPIKTIEELKERKKRYVREEA